MTAIAMAQMAAWYFRDNRLADFAVTCGFFGFLYVHIIQRHNITDDRDGHTDSRDHHCVVCF